jgi:hypothetical protein
VFDGGIIHIPAELVFDQIQVAPTPLSEHLMPACKQIYVDIKI